jgi:hypothetical protein
MKTQSASESPVPAVRRGMLLTIVAYFFASKRYSPEPITQ